MKWNKDFNIVLAHRGPWLGLWATIMSCEIALKGKDFDYTYTIVVNGEKKLPRDFYLNMAKLKHGGNLEQLIVHPAPLSPPTARQMGTWFGDGDFIFFFDNHCLVDQGYFTRALEQMKEKNMDLLHSSYQFSPNAELHYEYELTLDKNFWATYGHPKPKDKNNPYRVGVGGHGGYAVRRSTWQQLGGYWTGFTGYGGEETYLDLKYWQHGKEVWQDPKLIHYHFPGDRDYPRHATDDYYRNMLMCAYLIGGEKWLYTVYETFARSSKANSGKSMFALLMEAQNCADKHAKELASTRIRDLDETLAYFKDNDIPH